MSEACGFKGSDIMFSSNDTPAQDMKKAYDLGAYINLDDLTTLRSLKRSQACPKPSAAASTRACVDRPGPILGPAVRTG